MQREKCILVIKGSKKMNLFQKEQENEKKRPRICYLRFSLLVHILLNNSKLVYELAIDSYTNSVGEYSYCLTLRKHKM